MTSERQERLRQTALRRQTDLTVVLENVHDPHNISAVMRSCEAVGIPRIYLLYTDKRLHLQPGEPLRLGHKSSAGTRRWVDVWYYEQVECCFEELRRHHEHILGTHLAEHSKSLYELDLCQSTALVFGNEHDGLSEQALAHCTGNVIIPLQGMVQSLNISVACAVSVFEAMRQRIKTDAYLPKVHSKSHLDIAETYRLRHEEKFNNDLVYRK